MKFYYALWDKKMEFCLKNSLLAETEKDKLSVLCMDIGNNTNTLQTDF